jgi:hypothetical protein
MPRNKPDMKKLQQEVDSFNRRFAVGDPVDYLEVIEEGKAQRLRTRTPAQILSGHTAVVWLEGKSGCVCCSHCFMPRAASVAGTQGDQR